jgi:hypothetical protein
VRRFFDFPNNVGGALRAAILPLSVAPPAMCPKPKWLNPIDGQGLNNLDCRQRIKRAVHRHLYRASPCQVCSLAPSGRGRG